MQFMAYSRLPEHSWVKSCDRLSTSDTCIMGIMENIHTHTHKHTHTCVCLSVWTCNCVCACECLCVLYHKNKKLCIIMILGIKAVKLHGFNHFTDRSMEIIDLTKQSIFDPTIKCIMIQLCNTDCSYIYKFLFCVCTC